MQVLFFKYVEVNGYIIGVNVEESIFFNKFQNYFLMYNVFIVLKRFDI